MRLIDNKCSNCGARIEKRDSNLISCEYCGSQYDIEPLIETKLSKVQFVPSRPQISIDILFLLTLLFVFPAIIYCINILIKRRQWNNNYGKTPLGLYYKNNPRPQLSWLFMVVLFYFGVIPAIIYYSYNKKRLQEWHDNVLKFKVA